MWQDLEVNATCLNQKALPPKYPITKRHKGQIAQSPIIYYVTYIITYTKLHYGINYRQLPATEKAASARTKLWPTMSCIKQYV